jgi:hypothetical protein
VRGINPLRFAGHFVVPESFGHEWYYKRCTEKTEHHHANQMGRSLPQTSLPSALLAFGRARLLGLKHANPFGILSLGLSQPM